MSGLETFKNINERLLSALIGLARATEGNEELITEETTSLLVKGLSLTVFESKVAGTESEEAHQLTELLAGIREEKKRLVPNCFDCVSPCGRTADYEMQEFWNAEEEQVTLKLDIVKRLKEISGEVQKNGLMKMTEKIDACYEALIVLGWNGSRESLLRVWNKLK